MERYRFHPDGAVYFVTFSVVQWLPVFVSGGASQIIVDSLNFCHDNKGLRVNAYVIMPTHLHAIVFHNDFQSHELERVLVDFRKFTGRGLADFCLEHMPRCFAETIRRESGGDRERRFWQSSRHPERIESEAFWRQKLDYLHENPCRKGLVLKATHWRFSSAAYWLSEAGAASEVKLSGIRW